MLAKSPRSPGRQGSIMTLRDRMSERRGSRSRTGLTASTTDSTEPAAANAYAILVDGIHGSISGSGLPFKAELKGYWRGVIARHSKDGSDWSAAQVPFGMLKVLDGTQSIQHISDILKHKLEKLDSLRSQPRPSHDAHDETTNAEQPSKEPPVPQYVLFGVGLGCWVIRNLLAQDYLSGRGLRTVGLIFLDDTGAAMDSAHQGCLDEAQYLNTIRNWRSRYCSNLKAQTCKGKLEELARQLCIIDQNYTKAMKDRAARGAGIMKCIFVDVKEEATIRSDVRKRKGFRQRIGKLFQKTKAESIEPISEPGLGKVEVEIDRQIHATESPLKVSDQSLHPALLQPIPEQIPVSGYFSSSGKSSAAPASSGTPVTSPANSPRGSQILSRSGAASPDGLTRWRSNSSAASEPPTNEPDLVTEDDIWKAFQDGHKYLEEERFRKAGKNFKKVLDRIAQPETVSRSTTSPVFDLRLPATVRLGIVQVYLGDYSAAKKTLSDAAAALTAIETKNSDEVRLNTEAERWLGIACVLCGDYGQAAIELQAILNSPGSIPNSTDALNLEILQDLAVAYAYSGNFIECSARTKLLRQYVPKPEDLKADTTTVLQLGIWLSVAEVDFVLGDYRVALVNANKAWAQTRRLLGPRHVRTFESARLRIVLLGLNSRHLEAEEFCRTTLTGMIRELGDDHPVTLETKNILGFIFRTQARLVQSIEYGKSASDAMAAKLTDRHPKTFAAKSEMTTKYRMVGHYRLAASTIDEEVVELCQKRYGWRSNSTLRFITELAQVWCCAGYLDLPEPLLIRVVQLQVQAYSLREPGKSTTSGRDSTALPYASSSTSADIVRPILAAIRHERLLLPRKAQRQAGGDTSNDSETDADAMQSTDDEVHGEGEARSGPSELIVHPHLVNTLSLIASLHLHKDQPEADQLAIEILEELYAWNRRRFGGSHAFTLQTRYDLAIALRETGEERPEKAERHIRRVYELRRAKLPLRHPDTLSAQRELIMTQLMMGPSDAPVGLSQSDDTAQAPQRISEASPISSRRPSFFKNETSNSATLYSEASDPSSGRSQTERDSWDIFWYQQEKLGDFHPETLKTLFWIFLLHLEGQQGRLDDPSTLEGKTFGDLLGRLRHQKILNQRPLESQWMQKKMASLLEESNRYPEAAAEIRDYLTSHPEIAMLDEEIKQGIIARITEIMKELDE